MSDNIISQNDAGLEQPIIFIARNNHTPACGTPPAIATNFDDAYTGYFENQFGEQAIFVYHYKEKRGVLYMGDADWEKAYTVVDGMVKDLILDEPETMWLLACWCAATREGPREVMKRRQETVLSKIKKS